MTTTMTTTTTSDRQERRPGGGQGLNLALVLIVHFVVGFFWVFAIGGIFGTVFDWKAGLLWGLSAAVTWLVDGIRIGSGNRDPAETWGLTFLWWVKSFIAPIVLGIEVLRLFAGPQDEAPEPAGAGLGSAPHATPPPPAPPPTPTPGLPNNLAARLDDFARRLAGLESELRELRRLAAEPTAVAPVLQKPVPP
ncbi:MAG: hypothetical protein ACRDKU_03530, partial [Gaiellaceae bacterium]